MPEMISSMTTNETQEFKAWKAKQIDTAAIKTMENLSRSLFKALRNLETSYMIASVGA